VRDSDEGPERNRDAEPVPSEGKKARGRRGRVQRPSRGSEFLFEEEERQPLDSFEDVDEVPGEVASSDGTSFFDAESRQAVVPMEAELEPPVEPAGETAPGPAPGKPAAGAAPGAREKPGEESDTGNGEDELALPPGRVRRRSSRGRARSGGLREVLVGGPKFIIPLIIIAAIATLVLSIFYTRLRDAHWVFWFYLVIFIVAAQFDLKIKGGGEINLGLAPLLAALLSIKGLPTVGVVWIYLFGTIAELIVRLLGGEVTRDEMLVMLLNYSGVGIMAVLFHGIFKVMPKKPLFLGNYWPGLIVAVVIAAAAYFVVQVFGMTFELSQEGYFPAAVYLKSAFRKSWLPYTAISFVGILMGLTYLGVGMWSVLFVMPILLVLRYAYNRVAATDRFLLETIRTLAAIPEETGMVDKGHAERVARLSAAVARELGLSPDDVYQVEYAAYLHDIGAIRKGQEPAPEQQQLMETEGVISGGGDVIAGVGYLDIAAEILRGREGLMDRVEDVGKRRAVSMGAGILRAADDFEGLLTGRGDREPLSESDALTEMNLERGTRYDSKVLRAITRVMARLPREGLLPSAEGSSESSSFWREQES
jgi:hypothetical protein